MQQLRLVGPQDGHTNLVVEAPDGTRFLLAANDALLTAIEKARVPQPAPVESPSTENYPNELTPREIQTRIREGASIEDLVYSCGMDQNYVQRYAQPVLDERAYMVQLAQQVHVADEMPDADRFPTLHPEPATLLAMVHHQLKSLHIPLSSLEWDAWRDVHGLWHIKATFDRPEQSYLFQDQEPEARWLFQPAAKQVENANQWAQVLSEDEPLDEPIAGQRLSAVPDAQVQAGEVNLADQDALLKLLRERRGTRLGSNEDSDDELAMFIARGFNPMEDESDGEDTFGMPRPEESEMDGPRGLVRHIDFGTRPDEDDDIPAPVPAAKKHAEIRGQTDALEEVAEHEAAEREQEKNRNGENAQTPDASSPAPETPEASESEKSDEAERPEDTSKEEKTAPAAKKKPRRSSVPSWDEIVFGTRGD